MCDIRNKRKVEGNNEQIPKIREIMEYGYTKEKAINSMIEDIRLMTREHQWEVCRCEYWKHQRRYSRIIKKK